MTIDLKKREQIVSLASDVLDIQYRIHCASELVRMVHAEMVEGVNQPDGNDYDGLFGAYLLTHSLDKEFKALSESLWAAVCELPREG